MLTTDLNPAGIDESYLEALNLCFPGWGDEKQLVWVLNRAVGGPVPDRMLIRMDGTLVAGSAVSYRWLERDGQRMLIGIMTGSWTLPEARGQGCFTRIIEESLAVTASRGGAILLAFVTEDNPSFRRLRDAGAALFPTTYFQGHGAPLDGGPMIEAVSLDEALEATLFARHSNSAQNPPGQSPLSYSLPGHTGNGPGAPGCWSVAYDLASWRGQLVARARQSAAMRIGEDAFALIDHAPSSDTTRLLALYPGSLEPRLLLAALVGEVSRCGRTLVGFASDAQLVEAARTSEVACKPGHITAMVASQVALAEVIGQGTAWSGRDTDLAEPTSPWFLGGFSFHSGDRM